MSFSDVASRNVTSALTAPAGTRPRTDRRERPFADDRRGPPTPGRARRPSRRPCAERNVTLADARLLELPPRRAENSYRAPAAVGAPFRPCKPTRCVRRAVPPGPPANNCPRRPARGNPFVPERTTVGRPDRTLQPGIVTLSQPRADAAPVSAPGLRSKFAWALTGTPSQLPAQASAQRAGRDRRAAITVGAAGDTSTGDGPGSRNVTGAQQIGSQRSCGQSGPLTRRVVRQWAHASQLR